MLGTAPSGSVQLQDYCVRPEKNGEPFFQSLSEFSSDPRRRANAPVNTYSALSKRNLAPLRSWAGHTEAAVTASRFSHGSSAACQAISKFIKDRYVTLPSGLPLPVPERMVVEHRHGTAPRTLPTQYRIWQ